jgi:hypothetical protein
MAPDTPTNRLREILDKIQNFEPCDPNAYSEVQDRDIRDFRHLVTVFSRAARCIRDPELRSIASSITPPSNMSELNDSYAAICSLAPEIRDDLDAGTDFNEEPNSLVAFISYSTENKKIAGEIKQILSAYKVEAFLAHEDIAVSQEWKDRIVSELRRSNIVIPILSSSFKTSDWTSQEIGFAYYKAITLFIPLSIDGTIPYGLISHIQSKPLSASGIDHQLLLEPIIVRYPRLIIPSIIERISKSGTFRSAEASMRLLAPHFDKLVPNEINALAQGAAQNSQVWSAQECRDEMLPAFIEIHKLRIDPKTLKRLEYQIINDSYYHDPNDKEDIFI